MMLLYKTLHEIPELNIARNILCSDGVGSAPEPTEPSGDNDRSHSLPTEALYNTSTYPPINQCKEAVRRGSTHKNTEQNGRRISAETKSKCSSSKINAGYHSMSFSSSPLAKHATFSENTSASATAISIPDTSESLGESSCQEPNSKGKSLRINSHVRGHATVRVHITFMERLHIYYVLKLD